MSVTLAMWSGPRNLSTAMMRSFGNRTDCAVWDEPFYGPYLEITGIDHPMRAQVLASIDTDWRSIAETCAGPPPAPLWYQKHMTHHMLPAIGRAWMRSVRHAFLIRAPERVLASYAAKRESVSAEDIGFRVQAELFDQVTEMTGTEPPVVAAEDVRARPEPTLRALCAAVGIEFDPAMLAWPPGPRASDGVWARHWYGSVENSTGFTPEPAGLPELPPELARIADAVRPAYERLNAQRIAG